MSESGPGTSPMGVKNPPLTNEQVRLLDYLETEWILNGALPSTEKVRLHLLWATEAFIVEAYNHVTFRKALSARGITAPALSTEVNERGILTSRQIAAIRAIWDIHDRRSDKKKLDDLTISTQEWNGWKKDPVFADTINQLTESVFNDNLDEVYRSIVAQSRGGDISASKLILEMTGRWSPRQGEVDVGRIIQVFIESVSRHVSDSKVMEAIASDLMSITGTLGATVGEHAVKTSARKSIRGEIAS